MLKAGFRARATLVPGEGDLLSYTNGSGTRDVAAIEMKPDAPAFGALMSEIIPQHDGYDLDCPTDGFSSIEEAIEDIRQGKVCLSWLINLSTKCFCPLIFFLVNEIRC